MLSYGLKGNNLSKNSVILKEVSISGNVCGEFAEISIKKEYINVSNSNIDCSYIFPIPETALITGLEATLGGRIIKAVIEDKEEARKIYENSNETGVNALTLEEINLNVFQLTIGKVLPGESINIKFTYIDNLVYEGNNLILTIPAILHSDSQNADNKEYFSENYENYKSNLNLLIEPINKVNIKSPSHDIKVEWEEGNNLAKVTLNKDKNKFDEDFIILFEEEKTSQVSGMFYKYEDENKGILYIRFIPKLEISEEDDKNNYIFLIDISHSMKGAKLEQAKNALQLCIRNLSENDSFNIIAFENNLHFFSDRGLVPFNEENLRKATLWIDNLEDKKGAKIFEALKYALSEKNNIGYSNIMLFTDDIIENEEEVLSYVKQNIGDNRIFTFGVDTSVNSYVINKLAEFGYGKAEFIYEDENIEDVVLKQLRRIKNPQVDIEEIDWGSLNVEKTYPRTIDYLYDREPFSVFAKVSGNIEGKITIKGKVGAERYIKTIDLDTLDLKENAELIQKVWSRKRIESIEERMRTERGDIYDSMKRKVIEISKESSILSPETSFIMLEMIEDPVLGMPITHIVPLNIPEETVKNISRNKFLDVPSFTYKKAPSPTENELKNKGDNAILDFIYPRPHILRILAKNQFADGSFCDYDKINFYNKSETTAMVLLSFTIGKDDILIYSNQITKAVKFLINNFYENSNLYSEKLLNITALALKSCVLKGILNNKINEKCEELINEIKTILQDKEEILYVLNLTSKFSLKTIAPFIFNLSSDKRKIEEKIVIGEEKNSIFNLAKLGILKS
ncbi:Ca-activated chloride channel family protein [Clostridium sp. USBA 49]|uniref:VIT and vWA domain-containing protein n=1 Tax=Clostridium TaxID=1485 RepID=UPI0009996E65|nr:MULTISPECIES: VIT and VWA domain-containing protein [Clostridium]SKA83927.1 Ca-activated chloride channel family protein [Clostridium sp. USBA 49]